MCVQPTDGHVALFVCAGEVGGIAFANPDSPLTQRTRGHQDADLTFLSVKSPSYPVFAKQTGGN